MKPKATISRAKEKSAKELPAAKSGEFRIGGDLPVWRLGFGAMRITGKGVWGPPKDRAEAIRVLRRAVELGINFIDTADCVWAACQRRANCRSVASLSERIGDRHEGRI